MARLRLITDPDQVVVWRELSDLHHRNGWGLPMVIPDHSEPPRMQFPPSFIWVCFAGLLLWGLVGIAAARWLR